MNSLRIFVCSVLFLAGFTYGVIVVIYKVAPYQLLNDIQETYFHRKIPASVYNNLKKVNFSQFIAIKNRDHAQIKRHALTRFLFGSMDLSLPTVTIAKQDIQDNRYANIKNLKGIDLLEFRTDFNIVSNIYFFKPKENIRAETVIVHQGHGGDFIKKKHVIQALVDLGYHVVGMAMPLTDFNNFPSMKFEGLGEIKLLNHQYLKFLQAEQGNSVKYLLLPVIAVNNWLTRNVGAKIYMIGASGGGWTTVLSAAIDTRIQKSFSIAGSYPIKVLNNMGASLGDYEQSNSDLLKVANYLEMYIMASEGENRVFFQIHNRYDPCCFSGGFNKFYAPAVATIVDSFNAGKYKAMIDSSHFKHKISDWALDKIITELNAGAKVHGN